MERILIFISSSSGIIYIFLSGMVEVDPYEQVKWSGLLKMSGGVHFAAIYLYDSIPSMPSPDK